MGRGICCYYNLRLWGTGSRIRIISSQETALEKSGQLNGHSVRLHGSLPRNCPHWQRQSPERAEGDERW
jgi:hypothetical protein